LAEVAREVRDPGLDGESRRAREADVRSDVFGPADASDPAVQDALLGFMRFQLVGKDIVAPEDLGAGAGCPVGGGCARGTGPGARR
jgi:hypothetical protein